MPSRRNSLTSLLRASQESSIAADQLGHSQENAQPPSASRKRKVPEAFFETFPFSGSSSPKRRKIHDESAAKAAKIIDKLYFEKQLERRCLQHAFNNVWQLRQKDDQFALSSQAAKEGSDLDPIVRMKAPDGAPMQKLRLDAKHVKAFMRPLLATSHVILYRGDATKGESDPDGHYVGVLKVDGLHFLLDPLEPAPMWISDPEKFYNYHARKSPMVIAVAGGLPQSKELLERTAIVQTHVMDKMLPVLDEITTDSDHNVLIEILLEEKQNENKQALYQLLERYLNSNKKETQSWSEEVSMPDAADMPIDHYLDLFTHNKECEPRLLLCTGTDPRIIPVYRDERGRWQARVCMAEGVRTFPLADVMARQQRDLDKIEKNVKKFNDPEERQTRLSEIASERQKLDIVALKNWPQNWPPQATVHPPSTNVSQRVSDKLIELNRKDGIVRRDEILASMGVEYSSSRLAENDHADGEAATLKLLLESTLKLLLETGGGSRAIQTILDMAIENDYVPTIEFLHKKIRIFMRLIQAALLQHIWPLRRASLLR